MQLQGSSLLLLLIKMYVICLYEMFIPDIRIAASESLPYLIECAKIRGDQYVAEMWQFICPSLLKAIEIEPENTVLPEHMNSLAKVLLSKGELMYSICLLVKDFNLVVN